jgi:protein-S-isoprenylcysteine O-methyltransferase Ste14
VLIPWLNLIILFISSTLFAGFYIPSLMPAKFAEKRGPKAWEICEHIRIIGTIFLVIQLINMVLWLWFPVPELAWPIFLNPWIGYAIALIIFFSTFPIWIKGLKDSGEEAKTPSTKSKMFEGIYNHIRHPQTLGEMSWYFVLVFMVNSLFLLIFTIVFVLVYLPIMIHIEEMDLIRRFGDEYRKYQQRTGALFPKLKKNKLRNYQKESTEAE